uniref:Uncharacterized protein n=1 Tax=Craspedostauros australis TaxID=1486917 RepID=A0A6T6FH22_9STRA|mmetsp:Transcript_18395/g.51065  ORF Transcript_18395/g.51065 Transcript_18395/m.51065 type:complete len:346 (+) Transcript_18395:120-1157(+)|eukprot:CAMPEP_0198116414 /NCGR_PEP_ID=MMETSP1442-20131203/12094_1 /TAXON_ID= /ORGANISM="Craspedostauros australis, Strain CCMP3328" /LENGTH=345 /DNA_ID=CAMNT_0043774217 /DNA_START=39 /DNA_END=1076 /DNA_ORIENTATION=-
MTLAKKKLEGVELTKELEDLLTRCRMNMPKAAVASAGVAEACDAIRDYFSTKNLKKSSEGVHFVPISVLQSMRLIWGQQSSLSSSLSLSSSFSASASVSDGAATTTASTTADADANSLQQLEQALRSSSLVFTMTGQPNEEQLNQPLTQEEERQKQKFQKRMERLRLLKEENKYYRLTTNINASNNIADDDITTKSMTYAASVGLNMIIAPISFGTFMYFFAGSLLDWIFAGSFEAPKNNNAPDIKRVLIGVVSGVAMLFIEMILFVIRTHELERHTRKKNKNAAKKPFGHYTSNTARDTMILIESKSQSDSKSNAASKLDSKSDSKSNTKSDSKSNSKSNSDSK